MNTNQRPGFGQRFWRAFIRLLAIVATLAILVAIGIGGYFGFMELQRSFDTVQVQMNAMDQSMELLRSDVNELMGDDPEQLSQISSIEADTGRLDIRVTNLEAALADDITQQQVVLATLTAELETAVSTSETVTSDIAALNAALTALQSDINENGSQIDALGGQIDGAKTSIALLNEQQAILLATPEPTPELSETDRVLILFRMWELISRARFRLLENNIGLATEDIESAIRTVDLLLAIQPEAESMQKVQARLLLAFSNLPDSPDLAATDLETAWDELDVIFEEQVFGDLETAVSTENLSVSDEPEVTPTETPTASEEEESTPTPAPEATTTPEATEEPTPEVTEEPTPTPTATP